MKSLIVVLLLILSPSVFAISEVNYEASYQKKIVPVLRAYQYGIFPSTSKISIHYATYTTNKASTRCLVILPGRTEPIEKYAEVIESLDTGSLKGQFTYFLMDHRGQGSSGRILSAPTDYESGYVDHFKNYADDVKIFMDKIVSQKKCSENLLLAHSLGAGIAVDFLQRYPEYFDRAALTSPMLKILTTPYSYTVARSIVLAGMTAGLGSKLAIGQKAFNAKRDFENNTFTTSRVRYEMAMSMFDLFPKARLGGVTYRWLNEVMSATYNIRKHYGDIKIPLRIFYAGDELYSEASEMTRLCDEAPFCLSTFLQTSKHEVLMDRDVNRDVAIAGLEDFFR
jgi:lysophospholipase